MQVLQLLISGVAIGCIYGLIALGFVLIYKATETVNFAQGDLMMLGAFAAWVCMTAFNWPYWLAILAALAVLVIFAMLLELIVIRPVLGQPQFTVVMLTIGIGMCCAARSPWCPVWALKPMCCKCPTRIRSSNSARWF